MARRTDAEMAVIKTRFRERIFDPSFRELSNIKQGKELGVAAQVVKRWLDEIHPERWKQILEMTRDQSAGPTLQVDDALLRQALGGDVSAIRLWYEIHGWSPKQNLEITRGKDVVLDGDMAFLAVQDALKMLSQEQRLEVARMVQEPAVLDVKGDSFGGSGADSVLGDQEGEGVSGKSDGEGQQEDGV